MTLDGKEMPSLDFYTAGPTQKATLIGEFTNLSDGNHILTLKVDPNSPAGRKKISLDSFDVIKAPAVSWIVQVSHHLRKGIKTSL